MMKYFASGFDFVETRRDPQAFFVDKTDFVKTFLDDRKKAVLITRPRRFGKTFNLSMLSSFLSIHSDESIRKLFDGTRVSKAVMNSGESCMEYFGRYPVIFMTLKDLRSPNMDGMLSQLHAWVQNLYEDHRYLLESPNLSSTSKQRFQQTLALNTTLVPSLASSLRDLTQWVHEHYGVKPILLIDEYDTPLSEAFSAAEPYHERLIDFFRVWLGSAIKDNPHLERAMMTGILKVAMMNLFSGVNSLTVYGVLDQPYAQCFGFTEEELVSFQKAVYPQVDIEVIRQWYNGYSLGGQRLYNPWSVLCCFDHHGLTQPYWSGSGERGTLAKALLQCKDPDLMPGLEALIQNQSLEVMMDDSSLFNGLGSHAPSVWALMLYAGYLTCNHVEWTEQGCKVNLRLPNDEVRFELKKMLRSWVSFNTLPNTQAQAYANESSVVDALLNALNHGQVDHVQKLLQSYLEEVVSFYDVSTRTEERIYHVFLLGMMVMLQDGYRIHSNKESGFGRFDIALSPKTAGRRGILLELKVATSADALEDAAGKALEQIQAKKYASFFVNPQETLLLGIAFCGKKLFIKHQWGIQSA